jgi:DNA-binding HxlR family transcriptional regulator
MTDLAEHSRQLIEQYTDSDRVDCPLRDALEAIADDKWKIVVILRLGRQGEMKFGEILRAMPGIRTKALTKSLRALEKTRLVDREVILGVPTRVSYRLTDRAHLAIPILLQLQNWLVSTEVPEAGNRTALA